MNIIGNRKQDSIGLLVEGWDNTFTNIRISDVFVGVWIKSSGNMLRNIHPLYTLDYKDYENSCGFINDELKPNNWFDFCYSDQFAVGFLLGDHAVLQNCFCFWYSSREKEHICIKSICKFNSIVNGLDVGFCGTEAENIILKTCEEKGPGVIRDLIINDKSMISDDTYKKYLQGIMI